MTHRAFDAAAKEASAEPITFSVSGFDHTFTVVTPLPVGQLILFSRAVNKSEAEQARALDALLRGWLIEADREKWDECLGAMQDLEVLGHIVNYVVEEAAGRPTQASSS